MGLEPKESSLINRLRERDQSALVSLDEMADELAKCVAESDKDGIRQLFDAYCAWELRSATGVPQSQQADLIEVAKRNFDDLAASIDELPINDPTIGPARKLVREVIEFTL